MGKTFFIRVVIPVTIVLVTSFFYNALRDIDARAKGETIVMLFVAWGMSLVIGFGLVTVNHFFKKFINNVWGPLHSNDMISIVGILYGLWIFITLCIEEDDDLMFKVIDGLFVLLNITIIVFCRVRKVDIPKERLN